MEISNSLFLALNNTDKQQLDLDGNPINGTRVYADDFKKGKTTILRFIDGFLDGDLFDSWDSRKEIPMYYYYLEE